MRYKFQYTTLFLCASGTSAYFHYNSVPLAATQIPEVKLVDVSHTLVPLASKESGGDGDPINLLSLRTLGSLIVADLPFLFLAIIGAFGSAYFNIRIPLLLGDLINALAQFTHSTLLPIATLRSPSIHLLGAFSLQSFCTFAYISFLATVGERVAARLKNLLFERIIFQQIKYFDSVTTGWLLERLMTDVQDFKSSFKLCISQGLRSGAQIIGSGIAMYMISPTLTAALMGCLPLVFFVGSLIGNQLRRLSHAALEKSNDATEVANETFTHIRSIKSLAMETQMLKKFSDEVSESSCLHEVLGYGIGCFQGLSNFALNSVVLGVLYLGGNLMARAEMDAGQLMAFLVATQAVHRSLAQISLLFGHVVRGSTAAGRISQLLSSPGMDESQLYANGLGRIPPAISVKSTTPDNAAPSIRFENVSFSYPSRPEALVFDNLSFEIPAGKVVALVGESGAGKSTVLSLLERFYDPLLGRITVNGVDLRQFSLSTLRGQLVGYISQEPEVFHNTIRENIRCARSTATDSEVVEAARNAQANAFVLEQLPRGYDTIVGGGSSSSSAGLSGGQRQRLVIARAFLKDAPILLLDEATSALDAESEFMVQSALQSAMFGRTVVIVAHRLSTIRKADLIIVMRKGKIVEKGTHKELLLKRGRYYDLLLRQGGDEGLLS